jgi:hypothetical protein
MIVIYIFISVKNVFNIFNTNSHILHTYIIYIL